MRRLKTLAGIYEMASNIVGAGEPTIDPYFEDIIRFISGRGMTTVLFTNGIRLNHGSGSSRRGVVHSPDGYKTNRLPPLRQH